ncbi:MAG: DUF3089 domain-containing protein [Rikenellaceae bacterium]
MKKITLYLLALLAVACCKSVDNGSEPMPKAPDYTSSECWYTNVVSEPLEALDVFYILPTCVFDWTDSNGVTYHYADVYNDDGRAAQLYSYELAEEIFGDKANFYAPYYRQITLNVWIDGQEAVDRLFPAAMADVEAAFENFIETKNDDRPFIIAGFSQGGKAVVELTKSLTAEERERLVAAYVIGYKVTDDDLQNGNIVAATRADDTGVTICYSSVATTDAINPLISDSKICINPVNWATDSTVAELNDSVTVTVDTIHNMLIVDGLDSEALYVPELADLFKLGNYHLQELELYKESLRENVAVRAAAFNEYK